MTVQYCDMTRANYNTLTYRSTFFNTEIYISISEIGFRRLESHVTTDVLSLPGLSLTSHFAKGPKVSVRSGPGDFTKGPVKVRSGTGPHIRGPVQPYYSGSWKWL